MSTSTAATLLELYWSGRRDFHDWDLDGAELDSAQLEGIDLTGASLRGVTLKGAQLETEAHLHETGQAWEELTGTPVQMELEAGD